MIHYLLEAFMAEAEPNRRASARDLQAHNLFNRAVSFFAVVCFVSFRIRGERMKLKEVKTEDAVGQVLCHDITQIINGSVKDVRFRKGHIISKDDVPILLSLGKDHVFLWKNSDKYLHENDAVEILCELCRGKYMRPTLPKEGRIDLIAEAEGLFIVDIKRLRAMNSLGEIVVATRISGFPVKKGDKLCGMRVVPLLIEKRKMERARRVAGDDPLMRLRPIRPKKYGLVTTGNEVFHRRIEDTFTPVVKEKMEEYGCSLFAQKILDDDALKITAAIREMLDAGAEMVICTGGMSVDPDDRTPLAIKNSGVRVVAYGAPVLPGSMFMIGYTDDGRPVCGLPGCVMYVKRTIFDLALPFMLADEPITAERLAGLGHGGLCINCPECLYPNCSFGKGT